MYLVCLEDLVFDLHVGRDEDGTPMLLLGELIELFAGEDGRIDAFRQHAGGPSLISDDAVAALAEEELEALVKRRLRLSMVAGRLLGFRFEEAVAALTAV
jgi:hypothetical protein